MGAVSAQGACRALCRHSSAAESSLLQLKKQQVAATVAAELADIQKKYVIVGNVQYSRKGAEAALLGQIGSLSLLSLPPTVHFQQNAPEEWTKDNIWHPTTVQVSSEQLSELDVNAQLNFFGADIDLNFNHNSSHTASYTLQSITFKNKWKVLDWLSAPENEAFVARFRAMSHPRIVTTAWMLVSQDVPEIGSTCNGWSLSVSYAGQSGSISGSGCGKSEWSFSAGTIIAYRMEKVKFNGEGMAVELEDDIGIR